MASIDFDAARRERIAGYDPIRFTLGGVTFNCRAAIPFEWLLRVVDDDQATAAANVVRRCAEFVADCIDGDPARWWAVLVDLDDPVEEADILAVTRHLVTTYTARPTSPSNGRSVGRRTTGSASSSKRTKRSPATAKGSAA